LKKFFNNLLDAKPECGRCRS